MHPDQIKAAAGTLIKICLTEKRPANDTVNAYTRARRYIGSKDRKELTRLVWEAIRHKARLEYLFPNVPPESWPDYLSRADVLPDSAPDWVRFEVPSFLEGIFQKMPDEAAALLTPAPTVLRALGNRKEIQTRLAQEGIDTIPTKLSPFGLILQKRSNLNTSRTFQSGLIEVQDEGSQLAALATGIHAGDRVLDYCAGAGGKTLIFAQMMHFKGHIVAHDIRAERLKPLMPRAKRAGCADMIETTFNRPQGLFTHVVVDAPCSGSGTWRRCPDAKWNLTPERFQELLTLQARILRESADFVENGGKLSYMTCSLIPDENQNQIDLFLQERSDFQLLHMNHFSPAATQTDGFFTATLQRC